MASPPVEVAPTLPKWDAATKTLPIYSKRPCSYMVHATAYVKSMRTPLWPVRNCFTSCGCSSSACATTRNRNSRSNSPGQTGAGRLLQEIPHQLLAPLASQLQLVACCGAVLPDASIPPSRTHKAALQNVGRLRVDLSQRALWVGRGYQPLRTAGPSRESLSYGLKTFERELQITHVFAATIANDDL
jgi:hypothetical protein